MFLKLFLLGLAYYLFCDEEVLLEFLNLYTFWENFFLFYLLQCTSGYTCNMKWFWLLVKQFRTTNWLQVIGRHTLKIDWRMYQAATKDKVPTKRMNDIQNLSKLNKTSILSIGITRPCNLDMCLPVNSSSTVIAMALCKIWL